MISLMSLILLRCQRDLFLALVDQNGDAVAADLDPHARVLLVNLGLEEQRALQRVGVQVVGLVHLLALTPMRLSNWRCLCSYRNMCAVPFRCLPLATFQRNWRPDTIDRAS